MISKVGAYSIAYAAETPDLATHNLGIGLNIRAIADKRIANHGATAHDIVPLELCSTHDGVGIKAHLIPQLYLLRQTVNRRQRSS